MKQSLLLKMYVLAGILFVLSSAAYSQTVEQCKAQLQTARHDTTRLRLLTQLSYWCVMNNQYDSLYVYTQQVLSLATKLHSTFHLGRAYRYASYYYKAKLMFDKSEDALKKSYQSFQSLNDSKELIRVRQALVALSIDKGDLKQAATQVIDNIAFCDKHKLQSDKLSAYLQLGEIYQNLGNKPQQHHYLNLFIEGAEKSNELPKLILASQMKAIIYEDQGDYRKAWPYLKRAIQLSRRHILPSWTVGFLTDAASNLRKQNQSSVAISYLNEAFEVGKKMKDPTVVDGVWQELSRNELQLGHRPAALRAAQFGLSIAQLDGRAQNRLYALENLTNIQEATGHYREALQSYKAYKALKDSLFSVEKNVKIAQIQTQYDVAKKENTILLLNRNAQFQQEQFVVVNQQRLLFGLGVAVLLLIAALTGYFLRQSSQQNKEIQHRSQQLQQALQLRDKLFSILTHDLRSPVANLLFSLDLLQKNRFSNKRFAELKQQVNSVYATIDNLLYWALGQQNGLRARLVRVNLTELVNEVLDSFCGMITDKQLHVAVSHAQHENNVLADEKMTQISLRNIVHNAIKFSPPQGSITLTLEQKEGDVYLHIQDTGGGMEEPDAVLSQVGEPTVEQGTGLGLVVSEELMRQNQGSLSIRSQPGEGTTITLTFQAG